MHPCCQVAVACDEVFREPGHDACRRVVAADIVKQGRETRPASTDATLMEKIGERGGVATETAATATEEEDARRSLT